MEKCFGYAVECPLKISHYYKKNLERCPFSIQCYEKWKELGGIMGWEGIDKYGEKRYDE